MPSLKFSRLVLFAAWALAPPCEAARAAPGEGVVLVLPLSGLDAGEVRQCGIRAISGEGANQLIIDIALERSGVATDLVVRATGAANSAIEDVRLETRTVQLEQLLARRATRRGIERRMSASDAKVTAFIHELMLRGTRAVAVIAQRDIAIDVPGPLSASVRAAYLNCAGDLYRPGE